MNILRPVLALSLSPLSYSLYLSFILLNLFLFKEYNTGIYEAHKLKQTRERERERRVRGEGKFSNQNLIKINNEK
jgi:hypothetical protein